MEKVYIIKSAGYDVQAIEQGVRSAAQALGVTLPLDGGNSLLHVDCPWVHARFAPNSHTNPAVIEAVGKAIAGPSLVIGGNSLPNFPTRYSFRHSNYAAVARKLGARLISFDEAAGRRVELGSQAKVDRKVQLPGAWFKASFKVSFPKLRGSTLVPFAGAIRHLQSLLPQDAQLKDSHLLPEKMIDLLAAASPDLIVVDAIQAMHRGGELSGEPVDLGILIVGTHPVAVDMVCAVVCGLDPAQVDFLQEALARNIGPATLKDVSILGDMKLDELRALSEKFESADPKPENFPLPPQIKIIRSAKARQAGASGVLADAFFMLKQSGVSMKSAPTTTIVIGAVTEIPPGKSEYDTLIFLDDTSRGEYRGYGRIVRLSGRNIPLSQILQDVFYAMKVINFQAELGGDFLLAKVQAFLSKLIHSFARQ